MIRILILADDLSGAADCGAACVNAGLKTVVALEDIAGEVNAEVLSVDADTRRMAPGEAAREVNRLVRKYACNNELLLFKKIDSTLRGNVSQELAATLETHRSLYPGIRNAVAVMAPAFPAIGRTTVSGTQLVHGQPLHELDIWRVQGMGGSSHIPDMLKSDGLKSALLQLNAIRSSSPELVDAMKLFASHADVLVCDAETDADLRNIAFAATNLERNVIWVGSAGLAYQLPYAAKLDKTTKVLETALPPLSGPLLFVIGSLSRNSNEQVRILTSSSPTVRISVPTEVLLAGAESPHWQEYERELERAVKMNQDVVLRPETETLVELSKRLVLSAALACMTTSLCGNVGALVASGGETARMVLRNWGVTQLRLVGELERGIPVSIAGNWSRQLPIITKAGDFGSAETLLNCGRFLHSADRSLNHLTT